MIIRSVHFYILILFWIADFVQILIRLVEFLWSNIQILILRPIIDQIVNLYIINFRLRISKLINSRCLRCPENAFVCNSLILLLIYLIALFLLIAYLCHRQPVSTLLNLISFNLRFIASTILATFIQLTWCLWPHCWSRLIRILICGYSRYMLLNWSLLSPLHILFYLLSALSSLLWFFNL